MKKLNFVDIIKIITIIHTCFFLVGFPNVVAQEVVLNSNPMNLDSSFNFSLIKEQQSEGVYGETYAILTENRVVLGVDFQTAEFWVFSNHTGRWETKRIEHQGILRGAARRLPDIDYVSLVNGDRMAFMINADSKDSTLIRFVFVSENLKVHSFDVRLPSPFYYGDIYDILFDQQQIWLLLNHPSDSTFSQFTLLKIKYDPITITLIEINSLFINATNVEASIGKQAFLFVSSNQQVGGVTPSGIFILSKDLKDKTIIEFPSQTSFQKIVGRVISPLWFDDEGFPVILILNTTYFEVRQYPYESSLYNFTLSSPYRYDTYFMHRPLVWETSANVILREFIWETGEEVGIYNLALKSDNFSITPIILSNGGESVNIIKTWQYIPSAQTFFGTHYVFNNKQEQTYLISNRALTNHGLLLFKESIWESPATIFLFTLGGIILIIAVIYARYYFLGRKRIPIKGGQDPFLGKRETKDVSKYSRLRELLRREKR